MADICGIPSQMKKGDFVFNVLRVPLDFVVLVAAGVAIYILRTQILDAWRPVLFSPQLPLERFILLVLAVSALFVLTYAVSGLYSMKLRMSVAQESARILVASSAAMMIVILFIFIRAEAFNSRFLVIGYWILATAMVAVGRLILRTLQRRLMARYNIGVHRILLIGNDRVTAQLEQTMAEDLGLGWRIVKRLNDPDLTEVAASVGNPGIDEVLLANPDYPAARIVDLVDFCHERHIIFKFVPNIYQTLTTHYDVDAIGSVPVVELKRTALDGWGRVFKRMSDIIGSALALLILSPLFAVIAFAIKWETAGPVLVRLRRMSRSREFNLYKFRSMIENAEELKPMLATQNERADGPLFKMRDDPRVTGVGRLLRRTRLDELPQFFNVFRGDISIVGPRPHQPDEIAKYEKHHRKVLAIKAGATGLAQVSGASDLPFDDEVALDTFYIENWSLWLDIRIMVRTLAKMLWDRSAV
jgi:exopolysaccharide biosynthesis polyprenyl glycosylphosphotransferase